jgi:hypothetical protein
MKKIRTDHRKTYKLRIKMTPNHKVQPFKVILQLRIPDSALPSNPRLFSRLLLKLLQISIPRPNQPRYNMQTIDTLRRSRGKISKTHEMKKISPDPNRR